jgi:hypothetical protein
MKILAAPMKLLWVWTKIGSAFVALLVALVDAAPSQSLEYKGLRLGMTEDAVEKVLQTECGRNECDSGDGTVVYLNADRARGVQGHAWGIERHLPDKCDVRLSALRTSS